MAGKALVSFVDFVRSTSERKITSANDILSEAIKHTYLFGDMLKQYDSEVTVQSGSKITDKVQFKAGSQFGFYQPNEQFSPVIEDLLTPIECNWRFAKDAYAWTDHEIELNRASGSDDQFTQYVNLKKSKQQGAKISTYEGMENALWATANNASMEVATGTRPYSIPAFVTEDGLAPSGFTTVMGVNPATEANWRNQVSTYTPATIDTTLPTAFEDMWLKLRFKSPKAGDAAFKETNWKKFTITTDRQGQKTYIRLTREANDFPTPRNDIGWAVNNPKFGGIDVEYIEALDDKAYTTGQPRYFWLNFQYLLPIMHSRRYMFETDPINGGHRQPWSWVVYTDTWYNLFCRSRKRQGIVVPA